MSHGTGGKATATSVLAPIRDAVKGLRNAPGWRLLSSPAQKHSRACDCQWTTRLAPSAKKTKPASKSPRDGSGSSGNTDAQAQAVARDVRSPSSPGAEFDLSSPPRARSHGTEAFCRVRHRISGQSTGIKSTARPRGTVQLREGAGVARVPPHGKGQQPTCRAETE